MTSAVLAVAVVITLLVGIIPPVTAEYHAGETRQAAVMAFWFDVALFLLAAVLFAWFGVTAERRSAGRRVVTGLIGFVVILVGLCFLDAAAAYSGHGPDMATATTLLFGSAPVAGLAGVLAIVQACRRVPRREETT